MLEQCDQLADISLQSLSSFLVLSKSWRQQSLKMTQTFRLKLAK